MLTQALILMVVSTGGLAIFRLYLPFKKGILVKGQIKIADIIVSTKDKTIYTKCYLRPCVYCLPKFIL